MDTREVYDDEIKPDWDHDCDICGARPIVPLSGMCGPCTFGEAETAMGAWYDKPGKPRLDKED